MFKPAKILVATDFTGESEKALAAAVEIAGKYHSNIELLYIMDELQQCSADYCMSAEDFESLKQRVLKDAQKKMRKEVKTVAGERAVRISQSFRFGNHTDEILREVDEKKIDLLVMGPHWHHKPWSRFTGHLTDHIMKKVNCEMLLVR